LIGDKLGSEDMMRLKLVNRIASDKEVVQSARALCQTIGGYPEGATRKLKNSLGRVATKTQINGSIRLRPVLSKKSDPRP
jgi:enoyl-CoA hydratase/carnithine racemase